MRVATYNVHGCRGTDGRFSADRVAEVIRAMGVTLVGLQEVRRRRDVDPLHALAERTGMSAIFGATIEDDERPYGNALLSSLPIASYTQSSIGVAGREPRGVLDATVRLQETDLRVIVTHFGLRHRERREQVAALRSKLESAPRRPTLLLGDFNEWRPRSPILLRLQESVGWAPPVRSFPSRFPVLPLDRIWVRPHDAIVDVWAHHSPPAARASDHLPVCAAIDTVRLAPNRRSRAQAP